MTILVLLLLSCLAAHAQIPATVTTHSDTIPIYGSTPTISAMQDGEWPDPATWDQARVPNPSDAVHIPAGRSVHGSGQLAALDIVVQGNLTLDGFDLPVRTITVLPTGDLKLLQAGVIAIRDMPINTGYDPFQFGHGLLVIDGALTVAATAPRQTWVTLAAEIEAGDTSISLASSPENWQPGDTLILPDTRQPYTRDDLLASLSHTERVTVQAVSDSTVSLTAPVVFDHLGWRNQQGEAEILPEVGNLTQPIQIGSENPLGTAGHVFLTQHADVEIDGLSLVQMGRTTFEPLDSTTLSPPHIGTNQIGRYALHLHHLLGRPNNGKPHQFRVNRTAIDGGPKWGVAIHASHWGVFTNNFVYDCAGGGIVTEGPYSYSNDISDNLVVMFRDGSRDRITERSSRNQVEGDHWHNKVGLALGSAKNRIVGNRVYGAMEGIGMAGVRSDPWPKDQYKGVHITSSSQNNYWNVTPPRYAFLFDTSGNQIWGSFAGIETWTIDSYPDVPEKMFPELTIVNSHIGTNFQDHEETATYGWKFRGDFSQVVSHSGKIRNTCSLCDVIPSAALVFKGGYEFGHTHYNMDVRGYSVGYVSSDPTYYSKFIGGHQEVATVVYQPGGVVKDRPFTQGWTGTWENITWVPVQGIPFKFIDGWYWDNPSGPTGTLDGMNFTGVKFDIISWLTKNSNNNQFLKPRSFQLRPWLDGRDLDVFHYFQSPGWAHHTPITAPDFYADFPPGIYKHSDLIAMGTPIFGAALPEWAEQDPAFPSPMFYVATPSGPTLSDLLQQIADLEAALAACQGPQ